MLTDCSHCHAPCAEPAFLLGFDTPLVLSISATGAARSRADLLTQRLEEEFLDCSFILAGSKEAPIRISMGFRIHERFDDLIPPSSGIRLFKGECTVEVRNREETLGKALIPSKVCSGKDPDEAVDRILAHLMERALDWTARTLEPHLPE